MYLVKDRRGYFYLCESKRDGGRVVRRKLAYLGRLEMPYDGEDIPFKSNDVFRGTEYRKAQLVNGQFTDKEYFQNIHSNKRDQYNRAREIIGRVRNGKEKPLCAHACIYCYALLSINPRNYTDKKIVERAQAIWTNNLKHLNNVVLNIIAPRLFTTGK